ncbi:hypothetical protein SLEP1_g36445 [Rubroshorea leprosula]|uniref:Uncharacterized protein n=1 Tax=Rubroshorea leprosula TaxID=152421 RepID=A0AAV5KRH6_9ROSI|nr:hypothetical protein SLEP1_g36445 [Rubroshorea leprosula]
MVSKLILFSKFRALCICGTRLTSVRRLSRLEFGFWGVTQAIVPIYYKSNDEKINFFELRDLNPLPLTKATLKL